MSLKVLVKRDSVDNWTTSKYIPRELEFVAAYDINTKRIVYKIGDGKTSWAELPELTKISELDRFNLYSPKYENPIVEVILNPFLITKEEAVINEDDTNAITL
jgi:hypothetical protein